MINKLKYITIVIIIFSCSAPKNISSTYGKFPEMRTKQILKRHNKKKAKFNTLQAKLKVELIQGSKIQSHSLILRLERGETIWINAFLNLLRIKITPERVQMYNKIDKTYFDGDFSLVEELLGVNLSFSNLENLLLGDSFFDYNSISLEQVKDPKTYLLTPNNSQTALNIFYKINPFYFKMDNQEISQPTKQIKLHVNYNKFQEIDKQLFPSEMNININDKQRITSIRLNLKSLSLNQPLRFPYKLPSGYKLLDF